MRNLWRFLLVVTVGLVFLTLFAIGFQTPSKKKFFYPYSFGAYAEELEIENRGSKSSTLQLTILLSNSGNTARAEINQIDFTCYLGDLELGGGTFTPEVAVEAGGQSYISHKFKIDYGRGSSVLENISEKEEIDLRVEGSIRVEAEGKEYSIEIGSAI